MSYFRPSSGYVSHRECLSAYLVELGNSTPFKNNRHPGRRGIMEIPGETEIAGRPSTIFIPCVTVPRDLNLHFLFLLLSYRCRISHQINLIRNLLKNICLEKSLAILFAICSTQKRRVVSLGPWLKLSNQLACPKKSIQIFESV